MRLPTQSAPVQRTIPTTSGSTNSSGVEASGIFDDILKGVGVATQIAQQLTPLATMLL
ncbi:MAG TPA: hypothetical protein VIQ31_38565 [Phormidium sp.]